MVKKHKKLWAKTWRIVEKKIKMVHGAETWEITEQEHKESWVDS